MAGGIEIFTKDDKVHRVAIRYDKALTKKLKFIYLALEYLSGKDQIKLKAGLPVAVYRGHLPTVERTKAPQGLAYTALVEKINSEEAIIIHDELEEKTALTQMLHEIMHKIFPDEDDKQIEKDTLLYLERIIAHYDELISPKNSDLFKRKEISQTEIKKEELESVLDSLKSSTKIDAVK